MPVAGPHSPGRQRQRKSVVAAPAFASAQSRNNSIPVRISPLLSRPAESPRSKPDTLKPQLLPGAAQLTAQSPEQRHHRKRNRRPKNGPAPQPAGALGTLRKGLPGASSSSTPSPRIKDARSSSPSRLAPTARAPATGVSTRSGAGGAARAAAPVGEATAPRGHDVLSYRRAGAASPSTGSHGLGPTIQLGISLALLVVVFKIVQSAWRFTRTRKSFSYMPFTPYVKLKDVVMTACTHSSSPTLTQYKGHKNPAGLRPADTSTGLVLNAVTATWLRSPAVWRVAHTAGISSRRFDLDAFLAVWSYTNRHAALQHEPVLRHMARIGAYREAFLSPELVALHGAEDGVHNIRDAFTALKLVCWLNTLERKLFSAPHSAQDDDQRKFEYFLPRFGAVLKDAEVAWSDWQDEYKQEHVLADGKPWAGSGGGSGWASGVDPGALTLRGGRGGPPSRATSSPTPAPLLPPSRSQSLGGADGGGVEVGGAAALAGESVAVTVQSAWLHWQDEYHQVVGGFDQLSGGHCSVDLHSHVGLAVLTAPEPLHYYSLWSQCIGADVVLCVYDSNRYEVECKFTQFVNLHSREVWPRLDFAALVTVLNTMEPDAREGTVWAANRLTDAVGPLLRLEKQDARLSRAARYGHPFERTIHSSAIPPATFSALVQSFMEFGMQGQRPRRGGWSWDELHALNQEIAWSKWIACCVDQHGRGELDSEGDAGGRLPLSPGNGGGGGVLSPRGSWRGAGGEGGEELLPVERAPRLSEPSHILTDGDELRAVMRAVPARYAQGDWRLLYCTGRHGISLHTLYRRAAGKSPTLLIIKDSGGHVFGAFASDPWRMGPRFYGSGETSVFTLRPRRALYPWRKPKVGHNDFFQFGTPEGLGVGGSGHFAFWLDNGLLEGSSNTCATFGSPCLASKEDFLLASLELWQIHT